MNEQLPNERAIARSCGFSQDAGGSSSSRYRVDTVPWPVRPVYLVAMWAVALLLYLYYFLCRVTSQIAIEGPGNHDLSQHAIFCIWHESWWPYFVVFLRYPSAHAMISHPAAYMKPVHIVFRLMGLDPLFLGSSGEEGRQALNKLSFLVRNGWSTTISPDGPYGPARPLRKGVLHLSLQSGVPVVPLIISSSRFIPWRRWDCKKFPLPFNRFKIIVHEPVEVNAQDFELAGESIASALNGKGPENGPTSSDTERSSRAPSTEPKSLIGCGNQT